MLHEDGRRRQEFQDKIPVADGIDAVSVAGGKAQLGRRISPVDGKGGSRQGPGPQGRAVGPAGTIPEALPVPLQHLEIGQEMVGKEDGLGPLQVGVPGHDDPQVLFRQVQDGFLEPGNEGHHRRRLFLDIQVEIGGHLVVAAPGRVELAGHGADLFLQAGLNVHVDIFPGRREGKLAPFYLLFYFLQAGNYFFSLFRRKDSLPDQHSGMGNTALDVLAVEAPVKGNGSGKLLYQGIGSFGKTSSPQFHPITPFWSDSLTYIYKESKSSHQSSPALRGQPPSQW